MPQEDKWIYSTDKSKRRRRRGDWEDNPGHVKGASSSHAAGGTKEEREAKRKKAKEVLNKGKDTETQAEGVEEAKPSLAGLAKSSKPKDGGEQKDVDDSASKLTKADYLEKYGPLAGLAKWNNRNKSKKDQ